MCGIVGYVGQKQALELVVGGLRRLEYRGYDSAGLAVIEGRNLRRKREVGLSFRCTGIGGEIHPFRHPLVALHP